MAARLGGRRGRLNELRLDAHRLGCLPTRLRARLRSRRDDGLCPLRLDCGLTACRLERLTSAELGDELGVSKKEKCRVKGLCPGVELIVQPETVVGSERRDERVRDVPILGSAGLLEGRKVGVSPRTRLLESAAAAYVEGDGDLATDSMIPVITHGRDGGCGILKDEQPAGKGAGQLQNGFKQEGRDLQVTPPLLRPL